MRLQIEAKELTRIVGLAGLPTGRATVSILECVHLSAKDNRLTAMGTSMDTEVHATCEAAVAEAGKCSVNFADLKAITSRLRGAVRMSLDGATLCIEATGSRLKVPVLSDEIPRIKKPEAEAEIDGGAEAFLACHEFCATDEVRTHINGVCFDSGAAVATDGQRMIVTPCEGGHGQIIPASAAKAISKIGGRLFLGERTWRVEAEGCAAIGALASAQYPNWQSLVHKNAAFSECRTDDLVSAIEMATVGRAKWTVISLGGDGLEVSGDRFAGQHIESKCGVPADGPGAGLVVDTANILKCLKPFLGQTVKFSPSGQGVMISSDDRPEFTIMNVLRDVRTEIPEAA